MSEHVVSERKSAVPGDLAYQATCSCGWLGLWRSHRDDGGGWYGKVGLDAATHLRLAADTEGASE